MKHCVPTNTNVDFAEITKNIQVPLCNRKHEKINSIHKLQLLFDCNFDSATSIGSGRNADLRNTSSHNNFWADTRKPIRFGGNYKQMFKSVWIKAA